MKIGNSCATQVKQSELAKFLKFYCYKTKGLPWFGGFVVDAFAGNGDSDPWNLSESSPSVIAKICGKTNLPYVLIESDRRHYVSLVQRFGNNGAARPRCILCGRWEREIETALAILRSDSGNNRQGGLLYMDPNGLLDHKRLAELLERNENEYVDCLINLSATTCKRSQVWRGGNFMEQLLEMNKKYLYVRKLCPINPAWQWTMVFLSNMKLPSNMANWHERNSAEGKMGWKIMTQKLEEHHLDPLQFTMPQPLLNLDYAKTI